MDASVPPVSKRRWKGWVLILISLVSVGVVFLVLWFLPAVVLQYLAGKSLGKIVRIQRLSIYPAISAEKIVLYRSRDEFARNEPLAVLRDVRVSYTLFPKDNRFLEELSVGTAEVNITGKEFERTDSFDHEKDDASEERRVDPLPFIPRKVSISHLQVTAETEDWHVQISGLEGSGYIDNLNSFRARLDGDHVTCHTRHKSASENLLSADKGKTTFSMQYVGGVIRDAVVDLSLPGLASGRTEIHGQVNGGVFGLQWTADNFELEKPLLDVLTALCLRYPITFERLDLRRSTGWFPTSFFLPQLIEATIEGNIYGVSLGVENAAPHLDQIALEGKLISGKGTLYATLSNGDRMQFENPDFSSLRITAENWPRASVLQLLPLPWQERFQPWFPEWRDVSWNVLVTSTDTSYDVTLKVVPRAMNIAGAGVADGALSFAKETTPNQPSSRRWRPTHFRCSIRHDKTPEGMPFLQIDGTSDPETGNLSFDTTLNKCPSEMLRVWLPWGVMPRDASGVFSGKVTFLETESTSKVIANLKGDNVRLAGFRFPENEPAVFTSEILLGDDFQHARAQKTILHAGKGLAIVFEQTELTFSPFSIRTRLVVNGNLAEIAEGYGNQYEWRGNLTGTIPLTYENNTLTIRPDLAVDEGCFDSFTTASDVPATLIGKLTYNSNTNQIRFDRFSFVWDEQNTLSTEPFLYELSNREGEVSFIVKSDLRPLRQWGYVSTVQEGSLSISGIVQLASATYQYEADMNLKADLLSVRDERLLLNDVEIKGKYKNQKAEGDFQCEKLVALGLVCREVAGTWLYSDGVLESRDIRGNSLNGTVHVRLVQRIQGEPRKGELTGRLEQADLARFTEEFKPKDIILAGIVNAEIAAEWAQTGLSRFELHVRSERDLSVNRSFLEWLLLSQYEQGKWSDKMLKTVRDKALGPANQRPFDSGSLDLYWQGNEYTGEVTLKSKGLNLTITPRIDPEVVSNALVLRQEHYLDQVMQSLGKAFGKDSQSE